MSVRHRKQLAVSRRVRVPGPSASWTELNAFAQTYDAMKFLSGSAAAIGKIAYRPVFEALANGSEIGPELGIDLLRAALSFQARSDAMAGAQDFSSPEVEEFYRRICAELHRRQAGWLDEQR